MATAHPTGVYAIRNTVNGKRYVGSTTSSLRGRWRRHRRELNPGKHANRKLQRAWNKYGEAAFVFEVLETCEREDCVEREQRWMDTLRAADDCCGYNICPVAGNTLGVKFTPKVLAKVRESLGRMHADPAVRAKMSEALKRTWDDPAGRAERTEANRRRVTPEFRAKRSEGQRKKWEDPEYRARMTEVARERGRDPAHRAKLSAAEKGRKLSAEALAIRRAALSRPETRAKMSASAKAYQARKRAAAEGRQNGDTDGERHDV
jgi:group I intron endonuclease